MPVTEFTGQLRWLHTPMTNRSVSGDIQVEYRKQVLQAEAVAADTGVATWVDVPIVVAPAAEVKVDDGK
jgi:hypothetical protein